VLFSAAVTSDPQDAVAREAQIFARHLVGRTPPAAAVGRYRDARRAIFADGNATRDPLLAFVRRHPWSVAPLDAVASLLQPGGPLHAGVLTMAAILETSPEFADEFLPRSVSRAAFLWQLIASGLVTAASVVAGLLLLPLARRGRA
jgi:hypothetical protein